MNYSSETRLTFKLIRFGFFMHWEMKQFMHDMFVHDINTSLLYITGSSNSNTWALIELDGGGMNLCRGISDGQMEFDNDGLLKIIGVDLIEH